MLSKTKTDNTTDRLRETAVQGGLILMAAAATLGLIELPQDVNKRAVIPARPVFGFAEQGQNDINPLRREREEAGPHYVSYSVAQRTPGRTGKY